MLGGLLIGVSIAMLLWLNGRIAGISGIISGILHRDGEDKTWRVAFILGLLLSAQLLPVAEISDKVSVLLLIAAGFLVGFGTRLANGCTSGHGVCGLSRGSPRSIVATLTFISAGIASVFILRHVI